MTNAICIDLYAVSVETLSFFGYRQGLLQKHQNDGPAVVLRISVGLLLQFRIDECLTYTVLVPPNLLPVGHKDHAVTRHSVVFLQSNGCGNHNQKIPSYEEKYGV